MELKIILFFPVLTCATLYCTCAVDPLSTFVMKRKALDETWKDMSLTKQGNNRPTNRYLYKGYNVYQEQLILIQHNILFKKNTKHHVIWKLIVYQPVGSIEPRWIHRLDRKLEHKVNRTHKDLGVCASRKFFCRWFVFLLKGWSQFIEYCVVGPGSVGSCGTQYPLNGHVTLRSGLFKLSSGEYMHCYLLSVLKQVIVS